MGKKLIIKGADFRANAVDHFAPITEKELTVVDFTVRQNYVITRENLVVASNPGYAGCDTPISEYVGREITIIASTLATYVTFTKKAFADSAAGENILVSDSTLIKLENGESITLTIPSNAQYLYLLKDSPSGDRFPSKIVVNL